MIRQIVNQHDACEQEAIDYERSKAFGLKIAKKESDAEKSRQRSAQHTRA